jgi:hypothetical protein
LLTDAAQGWLGITATVYAVGKPPAMCLGLRQLNGRGDAAAASGVSMPHAVFAPHRIGAHISDGGEHGYGDEVKNQEEGHHMVGHRAPES